LLYFFEQDISIRRKLLPDYIREDFKRFEFFAGKDDSREIARYGGSYDSFKELYFSTVSTNRQLLSMHTDDYQWKSRYRKALSKKFGESSYFFIGDAQTPIVFELPAKSEFEINIPPEELEQDVGELIALYKGIFFGKIFARISIKFDEREVARFTLPEYPWISSSKGSSCTLSIDGHRIDLTPTSPIATLANLKLNENTPVVEIESHGPCQVGFYLPMNVSFWNSQFVSLTCKEHPTEAIVAYR
jgi:hypothetical protein